MKITHRQLRSLIREEFELCESWKSRNVRSRSTSDHLPKYGNECDPYLKMLIADADPSSAEENMNVYEDPDQDLEAMCAWKLDDDLRNHYKVKKLAKVRNALKKAKISNTKPRTVIDSKGVVINDKDEEGVVRYDFQTWIQDIEKA